MDCGGITRFDPPTNEQRGLYWIWLEAAAPELEMTKNELHQALKALLNKGNSTMDLHTVQFTHYMEGVKIFLEEAGINLPE